MVILANDDGNDKSMQIHRGKRAIAAVCFRSLPLSASLCMFFLTFSLVLVIYSFPSGLNGSQMGHEVINERNFEDMEENVSSIINTELFIRK